MLEAASETWELHSNTVPPPESVDALDIAQSEQAPMPLDQGRLYQGLVRRLLAHEYAMPNHETRGIAVVSAHPGAGVTHICNALRDCINQASTSSYAPAGTSVVSFESATKSAAQSRFPAPIKRSARNASSQVDASRLAITVDVRELGTPCAIFGEVIAGSLRSSFATGTPFGGPPVYAALDELSVEWGLEIDRQKECLTTLGSLFRLVLLDVPSIKESSDIQDLASLADGVVIVVEANRTTRSQLDTLIGTIKRAGGTILGYVLNKRTYPIPESLFRRIERAGLA